MAKRKKGRLKGLIIPALIALVGVQVAFSLGSQLPIAARGEVHLAQAAGPTTCTGRQVFVFSSDFVNADAKNQNRPIKYYQYACPAGSALRFLEGQTLTPNDACTHLARQAPGAPTCAAVFYAVTWSGPSAGVTLTEDNMNGQFKLDSRVCRAAIPFGAAVTPTDCTEVAKAVRRQYQGKAPAPSPLGDKTQVVIPSSRPTPTFLQNLQSGDIRITPHTGFGGITRHEGNSTTGAGLPDDSRTWGLNLIFKIPVK